MCENYQQVSIFQEALKTLMIQEKDQNVKEAMRTKIDKIVKDPNVSDFNKCFALGAEILEIVGSEEEMERLLKSIPNRSTAGG